MVPLPEVTISQLNFRLKMWAAESGVRLADLVGIIAERSGNRLLLTQGAFPIRDDDCVQALCDLIRQGAAEPPPQSPSQRPGRDTDPQLGLFD